MKSWKTTVAGVLTLALTVFVSFVALTDGDPTTTIDETKLLGALAGLGFIAARDQSEQT